MWIVKYWKPLAIAALLAAVIGGEYWYGEQRYSAGYRAAETKLKQQQTEALAKQTGAVLEKERQAQAALTAAQIIHSNFCIFSLLFPFGLRGS